MLFQTNKQNIVIFASSYTWPRGQWCSGQRGNESIFNQCERQAHVVRQPVEEHWEQGWSISVQPAWSLFKQCKTTCQNSSRTAAGMRSMLNDCKGTANSLVGYITNTGSKANNPAVYSCCDKVDKGILYLLVLCQSFGPYTQMKPVFKMSRTSGRKRIAILSL